MKFTPIFFVTSIAIVSSWVLTDSITNAQTLGSTNSAHLNSIAIAADDSDMTPVQKNGKTIWAGEGAK
ncbi:hypothetical protein [Chamaesiphon sp.]|uniref:hypothetical protein n=1 Tax=Chamaesiphon sp. TaxID=2814140 RepID=UPI0035947683